MNETYTLEPMDKPDDAAWTAIGGGIDAYNTEQAGDYHGQPLCFVVRDPAGAIVGGLIGDTLWDWFCLSLLWLRADLRGQGYGHRLLALAEEEARRRGAKRVYLDTFSFQAPEFYAKHGYRVFGELHDFPAGHRRYFMTKDL